MTRPPEYIVHEVDEKEVTIDWFFARGRPLLRLWQLILIIIGWVFEILPIVLTISSVMYRTPDEGWWHYEEGYYMWDVTVVTLSYLIVVFIVGFLALYVLNRRSATRRREGTTYDAERLSRRLKIASDMYWRKYGSDTFRQEQTEIVVEPYADIETYELRDLYRRHEVD